MHKNFAIIAAATLVACGRGPEAAEDTTEPARNERVAATASATQPGNSVTDAPQTEVSAERSERISPCLVQDGERLEVKPLRAIGTEPFWGARIEGRCVTYSTPEDQAGTRIWTRFSGTAENGTWSGALGGRRFELKTSPDPRCSDGMSDNIYPIAVTLLVSGEERRGCAEPLSPGQRR